MKALLISKVNFTRVRDIFTSYVVFQSLSSVRLLATSWTTAQQVLCPSPSPREVLMYIFVKTVEE